MEIEDKNQTTGSSILPQSSRKKDKDNETSQSNEENVNSGDDRGKIMEPTPPDGVSSATQEDGDTHDAEESTEKTYEDDQHSLDAVSDVSFESEDESLQTTKNQADEDDQDFDPLNESTDIKCLPDLQSQDLEVVEELDVVSEDEEIRPAATSKDGDGDTDKDLNEHREKSPVPSNQNETSNQENVEKAVVAEADGEKDSSAQDEEELTASQDKNANEENPTTPEVTNESDKDKDSAPAPDESEITTDRDDMNETSNQDNSDDVDISSMMETSMDEGTENGQGVPATTNVGEMEVHQIDSDDDITEQIYQEGDEAEPVVISQTIFEEDENDPDDDFGITELDISSMMQVEVVEGDEAVEHQFDNEEIIQEEIPEATTSRRPRRAAAAAAAKTIHKISSQEQDESHVFRNRRKSQEDADFNLSDAISEINFPATPSSRARQKCHICTKVAACSIVIKQYGADIYLCSNDCFSKFRNDGKEFNSKTLPCAKCGVLREDNNEVYFWETMNFCSDLCVGRYQIDVGNKCCTCGENVSWPSLGKYCVRFGSDIRQFCMPPCLESYKKNARVCFNCQLDIRRIGNVILANIPSKTAPKEFCSNDCVEMYCERNLHQPPRAKPKGLSLCTSCNVKRMVYKELAVIDGNYKTCSDRCWQFIVQSKGVSKTEKCEMCLKYVNMDLAGTTPVYWLSSMDKVYGFCSHVCKNLYILNNRKILACNTCKVKKYNFDLIEFYKEGSMVYAVCSLACFPKHRNHLANLKDALYLPPPTSVGLFVGFEDTITVPIISSVQSVAPPPVQQATRKRTRDNPNRPQLVSTQQQKDIVVLDIANNEDDDEIVTWADITKEEIDDLLKFVDAHAPKEMRTKSCSAKPRVKTVETQTDISELNAMERVSYTPDEIVHYIPVPIACPISMPFPGYFLESPVPIPFPLPIPYPVPIPIIIPATSKINPTPKLDESKTKIEEPMKNICKADADNSATSEVKARESKIAVKKDEIKNDPKDENKKSILESQIEINRSQSSDMTLGTDLNVTNPNLNTPVKNNTMTCSTIGTYHPPVTPYQPTNMPVMSPAYAPHIVPINTPSHTSVQPPLVRPSVTRTPPRLEYTLPSSPTTFTPITPQANLPASMYPYSSPIVNYNNSNVSPMNYQLPQQAPTPCYSPQATPAPCYSPQATPAPCYSPQSAPAMNYMTPTQSPSLPMSTVIPGTLAPKQDRVDYALRAWKMMFGVTSDPRSISSMELSAKLIDLVNRGGSKPNGEKYRSDVLLYISLGLQKLLSDCNRADKLFYDNIYYNFVIAFTDRAEREVTMGINPTIEESHFWDSFELGASSPGVLLFTLVFMFQKYFGLKTWEMQVALQFGHIVIQVRYDQFGKPERYLSLVGLPGAIVTEVKENVNDKQRCFVSMYEFYKTTSENPTGHFYKCLRQDYTPRTPWFTSQPLGQLHIYQMLVRASMIKIGNES